MEFSICADLYDAADAGDLERVQMLVEQGADKEKADYKNEWTPLFIASDKGHLAVVQYLVEQGAEKDKTCNGGKTPLYIASQNGHVEVVCYLVKQGADMEKTEGYNGWSPLTIACMLDQLDVARCLLEEGANRDTVAYAGYTPLHLAVANDHLEIIKLLMVYGADLDVRTDNGDLPIDMTDTEEIKQAIRDEPRRRMDHGHKRATEQDRHPNADTLASVQQLEEEVEGGHSNQLLVEGDTKKREVADEDQDSEPSDGEEDN